MFSRANPYSENYGGKTISKYKFYRSPPGESVEEWGADGMGVCEVREKRRHVHSPPLARLSQNVVLRPPGGGEEIAYGSI